MSKLNKQVYIPSIEASDIYGHMVRGKEIEFEYAGAIPYSLELIKLKKVGMKVKEDKKINKFMSDDVINLKFEQNVISGSTLISKLKKKIIKLSDSVKTSESTDSYIKKLNDYIKIIESELDQAKWDKYTRDELREKFYRDGFTINNVNKNTGEITTVKYLVYKRSSSKSRNGQVLFVKESLYDEMINWSRMYLPFEKDMKIDYPSLLAYEALVGSSLESTITIKSKNILIVEDLESKFKMNTSIIQKGANGKLEAVRDEGQIVNSLFDGESLLQSKYFGNGEGFKLLRNHMFKSAAFNCDIQKFLKDHCPRDNYDRWKIKDMFGNSVYAKNIELIITPSSLKCLKFSHIFDGKNDKDKEAKMYDYWKALIKEENGLFGVIKHEKPSKCGVNYEGQTVQRLSYQMINCLPAKKEHIKDLAEFELEYIENLKNDTDAYISHLETYATDMNSNQMWADLYKRNPNIARTKMFRDFKKAEINRYVTRIKKGKLRLVGDYAVMLGNGMELLYHAIGKFDINNPKLALKENQIYTKMFEPGKTLVGFRNPNTSPANVLIVHNTYNEEIDTYFNLTPNIVCVNAVNFELQDILSGCDYDSDTVLLLDGDKHKTLLELAEKCFRKYPVCINKVASEKTPYYLNEANMVKIDTTLAVSQNLIGRVVNTGQLLMSMYWDGVNTGKLDKSELTKIMEKIEIINVMSGITIDLAKKLYDLDIEEEIDYIYETISFKSDKPNFWRYVKKKERKKKGKKVKKKKELNTVYYECPMDNLYDIMQLDKAKGEGNKYMDLFLVKGDTTKAKYAQEEKIVNKVDEMCKKIKGIHATYNKEEGMELVDTQIKYARFYIEKLKVNPDTMYVILKRMLELKNQNSMRLMNILYQSQKEVFINAFKIAKS